MTALQELESFAQTLETFCQANRLSFACLKTEDDLLHAPKMSLAPYLYLAQVAEQLAWGHLVPISDTQDLFIHVRTPFAASASLKFVTLRTYALLIAQARDLSINRFERVLHRPPPQADLWDLLIQAADTLIQARAVDHAFLQALESAPFPTKKPELLAYRATFCSGAVVASAMPSPATAPKGDAETTLPSPAAIYLL